MADVSIWPGVGAPTRRRWQKDDIAIDNTGAMFRCIKGGDPGVWETLAGGQLGASGLSPAQPSTVGTSHNYETGTGDYTVNVLPPGVSAYAVAFQREGDAFPFLAVTAVGDFVISDGTYDPTNHPVSFIGLQWFSGGGGGFHLRGGGTSGMSLSSAGAEFDSAVFMGFLPTSDPVVAGQLWNSAGTLKVSAG